MGPTSTSPSILFPLRSMRVWPSHGVYRSITRLNCLPPIPRVSTVFFNTLNSETDLTSLEVSDLESISVSAERFSKLFWDKISAGNSFSLLLEKSMKATLVLSLKSLVLFSSNSGGRSSIKFSERSRCVRWAKGLRREGSRKEIELALSRRELREATGLKRLAERLSIEL